MQNFQRKMRKTNEILNSKQCLLNAKWGKKLNQNKIIKKRNTKEIYKRKSSGYNLYTAKVKQLYKGKLLLTTTSKH